MWTVVDEWVHCFAYCLHEQKQNTVFHGALCVLCLSLEHLPKRHPLSSSVWYKNGQLQKLCAGNSLGLKAHEQNRFLLFMFLYSGRESEKLTYITKYLKAVAMFRDYNNTSQDPDFTQVSLYISRCFNICCCCILFNSFKIYADL